MTTMETALRSDARRVYAIDTERATARFRVRHMMWSHVHGTLGQIIGEARIDDEDLARSEVFAMIDAVAVDTGHAERDAHLRSRDFLEVDQFPVITFRSTRVVVEAGALAIVGKLTIRDVTRDVTLRADLSADAGGRRSLLAVARVRRHDFGLRWNLLLDAGGVLVGDEVEITIELDLERR